MKRSRIVHGLAASTVAAAVVLGSGTGTAAAAPDPAGSGSASWVDVLVVMRTQADLGALVAAAPRTRSARLGAVVRGLRNTATSDQRNILALLRSRRAQQQVAAVSPLWIANEVAVRARPAVVRELAARPDVREVRPELAIAAPSPGVAQAAAPAQSAPPEPNLTQVRAPDLWSLGARGQGVVVASLDTGVDVSHPDLAGRWRAGTNSWFDPNGEHPSAPVDVSGHGTQTMGVIVGGDAGGSSVGMAPDATWIAAKIFNDRGSATTTGVHRSFQWLLDPDGNPATADAPNVVNNSWTMFTAACNLEFQPDLSSLRAAGIVPVFAAGNSGPAPGSVLSPGNLPEALAVGGVDGGDRIDPSSSVGPSACSTAVDPGVVAPSVNVRTDDLYAGYVQQTGTSIAAPHVTGAVALLLSAVPGTGQAGQQDAVTGGALDLGAAGIDPVYGYGRLDALAAYQRLQSVPDFAVAAAPSSITVTPGDTATYTVSVSATGGFTGDVALSLAGLPGSVGTAAVSPASVTGTGSAQAVITTTAGAPPGSYPLTITGTSGSVTHSAPATLVIQPPADFTVSATPSTRSVAAGSATTYSVGIASVNGFTGDVALSLAGLPASVGTASFTPSSVAGAGTSQLSVATSAGAPPGSYPLTITGTSGSVTHSIPATLVIQPPADFTVSATPSTRSVAAGSATTYSVGIASVNGFTGDVALSLAGLPASVGTASFTPSSVAGAGTSQLSVATSAGAPPGSYPLTITGTSGSVTHSIPISLTVTANKSFTLTATPAAATVRRNASTSYTVSVAPVGGFTGSVTLSRTGLPSGTTTSWSRNPVPVPGSSTLTVRAGGSTPRGTFTVRITGTSGALVQQVTVTLTVQ